MGGLLLRLVVVIRETSRRLGCTREGPGWANSRLTNRLEDFLLCVGRLLRLNGRAVCLFASSTGR
jgi:hypothetical protein